MTHKLLTAEQLQHIADFWVDTEDDPKVTALVKEAARDIHRLLADNAALAEKAEDLVGLLKEIEWKGAMVDFNIPLLLPCCPACGALPDGSDVEETGKPPGSQPWMHEPDCRLAAALAAVQQQEPKEPTT